MKKLFLFFMFTFACLNLTKANVAADTSLEICSTDGLFCKEIGFERGENEINITIPEIISGTILLVLKNNQNVINHQKYKLK